MNIKIFWWLLGILSLTLAFVPSHYPLKEKMINLKGEERVCLFMSLDQLDSVHEFFESLRELTDSYTSLPFIFNELQEIKHIINSFKATKEEHDSCQSIDFNFGLQIIKGRFKSVKKRSVRSVMDPQTIRLSNGTKTTFDNLLSTFCLEMKQGKYQLKISQTDCFITLYDQVLEPVAINMGVQGRSSLYTFLEKTKTRLPASFLDKISTILGINFQSNNKVDQKNELMEYIYRYMVFDNLQDENRASEVTTAISDSTTISTSNAPSEVTNSFQQDISQLGKTILLAKEKIDQTNVALDTFKEEEDKDDKYSFQSSLNFSTSPTHYFSKYPKKPFEKRFATIRTE